MKQAFLRAHGPTWVVAAVIYASWTVLVLVHRSIPLPLLMVLGGIVVAWHGSLQHETIHGHPGPRWAARVLGTAPLSLWLPYDVYRATHRRHHGTPHLTDPAHDPEAQCTSVVMRTMIGRLFVGPPLVVARFLGAELGLVVRGAEGRRSAWLRHAIAVTLLFGFLHFIAEMPLWKYLFAFVAPGTSLTLIRSFAEHRRDAVRERRTTVVEAGLFFRLLFLNNNLHIVHHENPQLPWFALPAVWRARRAEILAMRPELVHDGYLPLLFRHATRPLGGDVISSRTS